MKKTFVLDTNILMQTDGAALHGFDDNNVVITHTTLEELDGLKSQPGERGYSAREAIRCINEVMRTAREDKSLLNRNGSVKLPSGGSFYIEMNHLSAKLPVGWSLDKADNRIICSTLSLAKEHKKPVILITNDISMRIKAEACGVETQGYHNEQIDQPTEYSGSDTIEVTDDEAMLFSQLYEEKEISLSSMPTVSRRKYPENTYLTLYDGNCSVLVRKRGNKLKLITDYSKKPVYAVKPKNSKQSFALDALTAPVSEIPLVILRGPAGCGKTYLALAAGMDACYCGYDSLYDSLLISRSNTLSDEDMGYLPGTLEEKMSPLLSPFYDNLTNLLKQGKREDPDQIRMQITDLFETHVVEIAPLAYIRGRSIADKYIIIDEAQNLTFTQAKTIVTRAGLNTKIVILGDPGQIDSPKLTSKSNGLIYLSEALRDSPLCAEVTFNDEKEIVRSPLAQEAVKYLERQVS